MSKSEDGIVSPDVPEGCIINASIGIVQYVDPKSSEMKFSIAFEGNVPLTQFLGLLEIAKIQMTDSSKEWD